MKKIANKKCREVEYDVGDFVYLKLRPYRQTSMRSKKNKKLSPKYFGLSQTVAWVGSLAYRLQLPKEATIHPVFHVSQLKKALGQHQVVQPEMTQFSEWLEWITKPHEVFGYHKNPATGGW